MQPIPCCAYSIVISCCSIRPAWIFFALSKCSCHHSIIFFGTIKQFPAETGLCGKCFAWSDPPDSAGSNCFLLDCLRIVRFLSKKRAKSRRSLAYLISFRVQRFSLSFYALDLSTQFAYNAFQIGANKGVIGVNDEQMEMASSDSSLPRSCFSALRMLQPTGRDA